MTDLPVLTSSYEFFFQYICSIYLFIYFDEKVREQCCGVELAIILFPTKLVVELPNDK